MSKIVRNPDLPFQELQGEVLIVAPRDRRVHRLNEVAACIWMELEQPRTTKDLTKAVVKQFDVDAATAQDDVRLFVSELEEKGLLQTLQK